MLISDMVKTAVEPRPRRYTGDDLNALCTRVPDSMLSDLDAICRYIGTSRAEALRGILSEQLPLIYKSCENMGLNGEGLSIEDCRPVYLTEEEEKRLSETGRPF